MTLEHASKYGTVTITREEDTMIPHIHARDLKAALYGQGFANAQTRLWNMEKTRRAAKGLLSEVFGDGQLQRDKLFRDIGLQRAAKETLDRGMLSPMVLEGLQAYADGINDYVNNVGLLGWGTSGHLMPIEFYAFSIEWRDWTAEDSLTIMRLISLNMSFSFTTDIVREVFRYIPELAPLIDELLPFRADL